MYNIFKKGMCADNQKYMSDRKIRHTLKNIIRYRKERHCLPEKCKKMEDDLLRHLVGYIQRQVVVKRKIERERDMAIEYAVKYLRKCKKLKEENMTRMPVIQTIFEIDIKSNSSDSKIDSTSDISSVTDSDSDSDSTSVTDTDSTSVNDTDTDSDSTSVTDTDSDSTSVISSVTDSDSGLGFSKIKIRYPC